MARVRWHGWELWLLRIAAGLTLVLISVGVVSGMQSGPERWVAAALLAVVTVLFGLFTRPDPRASRVRMYLVVQSVLVLAVFNLEPPAALGTSQIFYLLTVQAALFLGLVEAGAWAALYAIVTLAGGLQVLGRPELATVLAASGANAVFLGLGAALRQTRLADARSRRLVEELRNAHDRLQDLSERAQQLAVVEERERIAREMHDALGHRLTVAIVQLEGASGLVAGEPSRASDLVDVARAELRAGLSELRDTVAAVRSPATEPLVETLRRLAAAFSAATGIEVRVRSENAAPEVTTEEHHALYRVVQEALTNVQRHALADRVDVRVAVEGGALSVRIRDDGTGFPAAPARSGTGLAGVRDRIEELGGGVELGVAPNGGAELRVWLPLARKPERRFVGVAARG